ncbi:HAD superfamily hydrolase (TIGR01458 family) [Alteromonadaceae bacterium 2753L.S.0a.02]|nr:HAD superfamily hydrolase (TIGR01458 family) [Alteromonadaceae bacterium 2753L.S.0a.02]
MDRQFRGLFLDLSGVVYEGNTLVKGAREAIETAREMKIVLRFVTNTATKSTLAVLDKLAALGLDARPEELFTAPAAARAYILNNNLRPFLLVHQAIVSDFDGVIQAHPNCVVIGDARDGLSYANLNQAFQLCKSGAPLVAIGMNKYFQTEHGLQMDAGGFVRAVCWAADCDAIIMGKPSASFFAEVVKSTSLTPQECLMVGDDVEGDVLGALSAGLQGCLVKTGKYQNGDENRLPEGALVLDSIANLF